MYMKPSTVFFMFKFKHCENIYSELYQYMHIVNGTFKYFITFLGENCIDKCDVIDFLRKNL